MRLPKPGSRIVLLPAPPVADYESVLRWRALDEKMRIHNLARTVAALPSKFERRAWFDNLAKRHSPATLERLRRLVKWYWRQRARARTEAAART